MSFILDALKKSEIERQRQTVPGLMDTRIAQRRGRLPVWALLLGLLLAVNIIVLAVVLVRSSLGTAPTSRRNAATAESSAPPASAAAADHFSPLDPTPVYAPEIPVTAGSGTPVETAVPGAPRLTVPRLADNDIRISPLHGARKSDPLLNDEDAKADSDEVLPTINELNLSGSQSLPELHLDVHVYGTNPAERFVYINMRKYHEGTTLQEGPTVEHIRRDGVILNFHGLRFILPRQS
jgi:general secretion pathway protein B